MTTFKELKTQNFMKPYIFELEDFRNVKDEDEIECFTDEYGEYGIDFYKPSSLEPFYTLKL